MKIRRIMTLAVVGLPLAAVGCRGEEREQVDTQAGREPVERIEQAHRETEQAYEQAQSAQSEARDKAQQADEAQKKVEEARLDLQKAEREAERARLEAEAAAQRAEQEGEQASTVARASQQEAERARAEAERQRAKEQQMEMERSRAEQQETQRQAQASARTATETGTVTTGEQTATGRVVSTSPQEVVVQRPGETPLRLQIQPSTPATVGGQRTTADKIPEGTQVRVTYRLEQDQPVAIRFEEPSDVQPVRGQE